MLITGMERLSGGLIWRKAGSFTCISGGLVGADGGRQAEDMVNKFGGTRGYGESGCREGFIKGNTMQVVPVARSCFIIV